MNIERLFELAEKANDTELVWLMMHLINNVATTSIDAVQRFHGLYGKKVVEQVVEWKKQGLRHEEVIESVEELMRTRLEA